MKAISIKEPWASLIHKGKKTIETRTWATKYRGPILLCASKKPEWVTDIPGWMEHRSMIAGQAFATARLVDVRPMTEQDQNAACCKIYPKAQAWILEDVLPLKIRFDVKGQLGVFTVDDELIEERTTAAIARSVGQEEMVKNIAKRWTLNEANVTNRGEIEHDR